MGIFIKSLNIGTINCCLMSHYCFFEMIEKTGAWARKFTTCCER